MSVGGDFGNTTMHNDKRKRLESKGGKIGSVEEFIELSPEE